MCEAKEVLSLIIAILDHPVQKTRGIRLATHGSSWKTIPDRGYFKDKVAQTWIIKDES